MYVGCMYAGTCILMFLPSHPFPDWLLTYFYFLLFQVKALKGLHIVHVSCGSRDAQTLALTDEGMVYSWGDGDFGKLGRGGSEGCNVPHNVERLNGLNIFQIECGAQFSVALSRSGQVWTW